VLGALENAGCCDFALTATMRRCVLHARPLRSAVAYLPFVCLTHAGLNQALLSAGHILHEVSAGFRACSSSHHTLHAYSDAAQHTYATRQWIVIAAGCHASGLSCLARVERLLCAGAGCSLWLCCCCAQSSASSVVLCVWGRGVERAA
jgi:hypothetical protein